MTQCPVCLILVAISLQASRAHERRVLASSGARGSLLHGHSVPDFLLWRQTCAAVLTAAGMRAGWYALCMVDALLMKQVADTVPMTTWSRTLYNVRVSRPRTLDPGKCAHDHLE